jgi:hypothetical protein
MRRDREDYPGKAKRIAKWKYAERQIDKWVKWSWENRNKVTYNGIVKLHNKFNIECNGYRREEQ